MDGDTLVRDYLDRLEAAASSLPADRRSELLGDVRLHIELALAESGRTDEVAARNVLERLGSPAEIIAAEIEADGPPPGVLTPPMGTRITESPSVAVETLAFVFLTVGALVLPIFGPILGLGFVWTSARWSMVQKRTSTMIVAVLLVVPVVILLPLAASGEITAMFSSFGPVVMLVPLAGIVAAIYLLASTYLEVTFVLRRR